MRLGFVEALTRVRTTGWDEGDGLDRWSVGFEPFLPPDAVSKATITGLTRRPPEVSSLPIRYTILPIRAFRSGHSRLQTRWLKAVDLCRDPENRRRSAIEPMRHAAHLESCLNRQGTHFRGARRLISKTWFFAGHTTATCYMCTTGEFTCAGKPVPGSLGRTDRCHSTRPCVTAPTAFPTEIVITTCYLVAGKTRLPAIRSTQSSDRIITCSSRPPIQRTSIETCCFPSTAVRRPGTRNRRPQKGHPYTT